MSFNMACISLWYLKAPSNVSSVYAVSPLIRLGPRYIWQWQELLSRNSKEAKVYRDFLEFEYINDIVIKNNNNVTFTVQIMSRLQYNRKTRGLSLNIPFMVTNSNCDSKSLKSICNCF